ncbi:MAG: hypothetical protein U0234_14940 [Sandaracinus sp.]
MKRAPFVLVLAALAGCDGGAAVSLDASVSPDAAPADTCVLVAGATEWGSLTSACLPRCTAATSNAYSACADGACRTAALAADTTPPGTYSWLGETYPLDCSTCFAIQVNHCAALVGCAAEVWAYQSCDHTNDPSGCASADTALGTCVNAHGPAMRTCSLDRTMGVAACFGP